jgi:hypothetical protein
MRRLVVALSLLLLIGTGAAQAQVPNRPFLFKDARGHLAAAAAREDATVLLVIAAMPGENARVAGMLEGWGGVIQFRADEVDYLRARVPTERVEELVAHQAVHSVEISRTGLPLPRDTTEDRSAAPLVAAGALAGPTPAPGDARTATRRSPLSLAGAIVEDTTRRRWPPRWSDFPLTDRYDPLTDMNGIEFRQWNPTFDGRGVTVAMIDRSMDPLLPELQQARALDGSVIPKIAAYVAVTDKDEDPDDRWVPMDSVVTAVDGRVEFKGRSYTVPRPGTFRIGMLERTNLARILNPDAGEQDTTRIVVLWDEGTDDVWVDTNDDGSFADERALTDYARRPEFGVIGTDNPETEVRESIGFGIQIDREKNQVGVLLGMESHATLVIGAAVASRGEHGRFDGVAPGARVANVDEGCLAHGQTEAVIVAFRKEEVDLAFLEQCSNITRGYLLRDGRLVPTVIYARLIEHYNKALMVPTHNYPVLGAPDDFVLAKNAIGVGGHEGKDNYFRNTGTRVEHDDNLLITGGYGPMGDGSLKPDVIAPSNYVSTALGFQPGRTRPGLFTLPPGYTIAGGTSTATPTAAGAVALLISAARQTGIRHDVPRIKHALTMSARYVPHLPAYKQGNGVVNVAGAWELLQALDTATLDITIESRAPVRHWVSGLLVTPHEGVGIYEREGWSPGDRGERTITFTRTSGPAEPMTFDIRWIGNEGAFSSVNSITLPLNTPTQLRVGIAPDTAGVHSAILALEHPNVPGGVYRTMAAVVAPQALDEENDFTHEKKIDVPRPGMHSVFYDVPVGTRALRIDLEAPQNRRVALAVAQPDTRPAPGIGNAGNTGRATYLIESPMPGTWEIRLGDTGDTQNWDWEQAQKDEVVPATKATLTVSALAFDVAAGTVTAADDGAEGSSDGPSNGAARAGATESAAVSISNRMAKVNARALTTALGSARREQRTIRQLEQHVYEIDVPEGSTALIARVFDVQGEDADLDVYVFNCTRRECTSGGNSANMRGDEFVRVDNPAAGKWRVVVDAFRTPAGGATYNYLDVVLNPAFGTFAAADAPADRERGASWNVQWNRWLAASLPEGRMPYAALMLGIRAGNADAGSVYLGEPDAAR